MRRTLFTLVAFTALAAWAGAQGPPPPLPAAVQVKQFKANRILIENLVDHGIDIANADNPLAHYNGTGPEIWRDTEGKVTHFVSSMGTTGTMGPPG